jgi:hypothetical protein
MAFKIIQSFFYHPDRLAGGWLSPTYNLVSWALSCHLLRRHYAHVELVTDAFGRHLLIDVLQLPYTHVYVDEVTARQYPEHLWAVNKLFTYARQTEPFLHVDGDIFSWQPLADEELLAPLVVQNIEHTSYYLPYLEAIKTYFDYIPAALQPCLNSAPGIPPSINAGVLGGSDVAFIRAYAEEALHTIDRNLAFLTRQTALNNYNVVFEQLLFYQLAQQQQLAITTLQPANYQLDVCPVEHLGRKVQYLHPLGTFKQNFQLCQGLVKHLNAWYPAAYERIRNYAAAQPQPFSRLTGSRQQVFNTLRDRYPPDSAQARDLQLYRQAYLSASTLMPSSAARLQQAHQALVGLLQLDDEGLANCRLRMPAHAVLVDTHWNWTLSTPAELCPPAALSRLIDRYGQKTAFHKQPTSNVVFWHETARQTVEVGIQNEVQRLLINGFRQIRRVGDLVRDTRHRFPEYDQQASEFNTFLMDSVRQFLSAGILEAA